MKFTARSSSTVSHDRRSFSHERPEMNRREAIKAAVAGALGLVLPVQYEPDLGGFVVPRHLSGELRSLHWKKRLCGDGMLRMSERDDGVMVAWVSD